jgi:hypothetical protein
MTETYFYIISCLALTSFISVPCCSDAGAAAASPLLLYLQYVPGLVVFTHLPPHALSLLDLSRSSTHQVQTNAFNPSSCEAEILKPLPHCHLCPMLP